MKRHNKERDADDKSGNDKICLRCAHRRIFKVYECWNTQNFICGWVHLGRGSFEICIHLTGDEKKVEQKRSSPGYNQRPFSKVFPSLKNSSELEEMAKELNCSFTTKGLINNNEQNIILNLLTIIGWPISFWTCSNNQYTLVTKKDGV
jgi:hypothetical protein